MPGLIKLCLFSAILLLPVACAKPLDPPKRSSVSGASGATGPAGTIGTDLPPPPPPSFTGPGRTDVAIFGGVASWQAEIDSLKGILYAHKATYEEIDADRLNSFSQADFSHYNLLLFPGGYAPTMVALLNPATRERIRIAVQRFGVNYLGFCAGAWISVGPAPAPGKDLAYGLGVADGPYLEKNFLGKRGFDHALDLARFPDGSRRNLLWYGGPVTPSLPGGVVVRYSDGTPAVSQVRSGKGLVIASGLHPAANKPILDFLGLYDSEAIAPDFAWTLLSSGIHGKPMRAFP